VASNWPDISFDVRNEILTLINLQLDIHEGILEYDNVSVPGWPPGSASSGLQVDSSLPPIGFNNIEYYFNNFSAEKK
jgi:hypothetical protein